MIEQRDLELITVARDMIKKRYKANRHQVAAALRTISGNIYCGIHIEVYIGRITVCGEAIALGMAATDGDTDIDTIVAVDETGRIISPCGMCREMIYDYASEANVIILVDNKPEKVRISELLPHKYMQ